MTFKISNCVRCFEVGKLQKTICGNHVNYFCWSCREQLTFPLPKLNKKIIYLDQNILSIAFRNNQKSDTEKFLKIFGRLKELANKQLIICPYSNTHDMESHLAGEKGSHLFEFIKITSRGKSFYDSFSIKTKQLAKYFSSFLNKEPIKYPLDLLDAFTSDINEWDSTFIINTNWTITKLIPSDTTKQEKDDFVEKIIHVLPFWRKSNNSLQKDYQIEIKAHADSLWGTCERLAKPGNLEEMLQNESFQIISRLLILQTNDISFEEKIENFVKFLSSKYFESVPHINISSGLWAIIKQKIQKNQFLVTDKKEKIQEKVRGFPFDIEHLSVYASYCDAIFFENRMSEYLQEFMDNSLGSYPFKIFSIDKAEEFEAYLDEIEANAPSEVLEELEALSD